MSAGRLEGYPKLPKLAEIFKTEHAAKFVGAGEVVADTNKLANAVEAEHGACHKLDLAKG